MAASRGEDDGPHPEHIVELRPEQTLGPLTSLSLPKLEPQESYYRSGPDRFTGDERGTQNVVDGSTTQRLESADFERRWGFGILPSLLSFLTLLHIVHIVHIPSSANSHTLL